MSTPNPFATIFESLANDPNIDPKFRKAIDWAQVKRDDARTFDVPEDDRNDEPDAPAGAGEWL